ncbi:putative membrane protein [Reinekea forsetii]|jgi:hypothetical protein|uniref:Putative membrane protein n=1 Tax=Reinekea forsetii TaxID=1336806 RepID=A0A2K8KJF7_9GAMM|nr:putative membrane protein [Reinekea forsetii]
MEAPVQIKQRLFSALTPLAKWHAPFGYIGTGLFAGSILLPLVNPQLDAQWWLLCISLSAGFWATYALLKQIQDHRPKPAGLVGWFVGLWHTLIFWAWLLVASLLLVLVVKLLLFVIFN